jgi:hypothetical protein
MIGISFLFLSCSEQEFKIIDTYSEITNISVYQSQSLNSDNQEYNELSLFQSFPNLKLALKLSNPDIETISLELISPNKDLVWDIEPIILNIDNQQYVGSSFINLISFNFEDGDYEVILTNNDGKQISTTTKLINNFNNNNNHNIYLNNNFLIFTSTKLLDNTPFVSTLVPLDIGELQVNYYDIDKILIDTKKYENNFTLQNYQFQLEIDNFENVYYAELVYKDVNSILTKIKIDLSSSHSSF